MFTVCVLLFASLTAPRPFNTECRTVDQDGLKVAREAADALGKDPLLTVEWVKVGDKKFAVLVRKLDGV